jgi:hypothetical protein
MRKAELRINCLAGALPARGVPRRMVSAAPVRAITVTEGCTMTLLDPVCRELLDAIGAALAVGDRPKDRSKRSPGRIRNSTAPGWSLP